MRIDLNHGAAPAPGPDRASAQTSGPGNTSSVESLPGGPLGEDLAGLDQTSLDQASLSAAHAQVATLAAEASQLPEIREARVQSLRQAIQGGQYGPAPETVAGGILDHMMAGAARAA
jgi:flagellar biosynthesis anti-sigma factor FlgM